MKNQYVEATTKRYMDWASSCVKGDGPPRLSDIERWLRVTEDYRYPMNALRSLCVGLREEGKAGMIQWIACELIAELNDERAFASTAEAFVNAVIRRTGVDDSDVRLFDGHRLVGTLHDLQLRKENANAQD
jgi:hypothetical protein